jgi:hypothetical protein
MQVVYPTLLWAMALLAIPIIIHLFHFRRYKKVVFSDVTFLKQLQEQNKSKQKLKDWLILLCRLLAIACLVLAFAQPFIPHGQNSGNSGNKAVSIFVDNSFSMNAQSTDGTLLETAKAKARAIVQAYGNRDEFQILTNNLTGAEQRLLNKSDALSRIDAIEPSAASARLGDVFARQQTAFSNQSVGYKAAYFVSDFQKSQFDLGQLKPDSLLHYEFVSVENTSAQNISVDSVFSSTPYIKTNQPITLKIKLTNHSNQTAEGIVVKVNINQVQKAFLTVNIGSGETILAETNITLTDNSWQQGEVVLTDYPITFDDHLFFTLKPIVKNNVLCISETPNKYLDAVFATDEAYQFTYNTFGNINYQQFSNYQLIIINEPTELTSGLLEELNKYVGDGGQVLIVPHSTQYQAVNTLLQQYHLPKLDLAVVQQLKIAKVNTQHALYKGVFKNITAQTDLPWVSKHYAMQASSTTQGNALLTLNNSNAVLWETAFKKGKLFLLGMPLNNEYTNLPMHSLFVPTMLNMALGTQQQAQLYYIIHQHPFVYLPYDAPVDQKLVTVTGSRQQITTEASLFNTKRVVQTEAIHLPGWYTIAAKESKQPMAVVAFNNNRNESAMQFLTEGEVEQQTKQLNFVRFNTAEAQVLGAQISMQFSGTILWRWFVAFALLFVILEIALIKLLK